MNDQQKFIYDLLVNQIRMGFRSLENLLEYSDPAVTQRIGQTILAVLKKHGLNAKWDGDVRQKIEISPILWRKQYQENETLFDFDRSYDLILKKYRNQNESCILPPA